MADFLSKWLSLLPVMEMKANKLLISNTYLVEKNFNQNIHFLLRMTEANNSEI